MKDLKWYIIMCLLLLAMAFLLMDSCGIEKKLDESRGKYDALLTVSVRNKKEASRMIKEKDKIIAERNTEIIKIKMEAEVEQAKLDGKITVKMRELEKIRTQPLSIERLQEEVETLEGQVEDWKEKFNLKKEEMEDLEFGLNEKYDAQVVISMEWKGLYDSEYELRMQGEEQFRECLKVLNKKKLSSKVKTGIVLGLAIFVGYSLIK